jgi:hypothetical protein
MGLRMIEGARMKAMKTIEGKDFISNVQYPKKIAVSSKGAS